MTEQAATPAESAPEPVSGPVATSAATDAPAPAAEATAAPAASVPPLPDRPPVPPAAGLSWPEPGALPDGPPRPPGPPRRVLRAVARWTAAVLVCGGLGTGVAFSITGMERTDVPGLATRSDGRWDYPRLTLPALPAGSPRPFNEANTAEIHHADLRDLLLPAPAGATADKKLTGGWVSTEQYLSEYAPEKRADLGTGLRDYAVRHIAARGWTMPDGTSSRVYLLRFDSVAFAEGFKDRQVLAGLVAGVPLAAAPTTELDEEWSDTAGAVEDTTSYVYAEPKPYGDTQVRQAYVLAGDTLALVVQERKGGAAGVPFHQTLILQNQLLG
ncbi:hypothetical protein [Streptomyces sp. AK02-01A]|uniref:hypothetical protein n=1 Tax=Streptomyces sp. AK02-01A TaxID=3028648 RepID=UPI0029A62B68|nr:hypothetical protein [Streptomyces sp. AK02-01A]MDX3853268.1 hypothetical protein [Streptomyces sp. AK02-01A]